VDTFFQTLARLVNCSEFSLDVPENNSGSAGEESVGGKRKKDLYLYSPSLNLTRSSRVIDAARRQVLCQFLEEAIFFVIALRPQTPKHIRGGWSHYTDTSKPVDGGEGTLQL
jgi:hypothetical protein